VRFQLLILSAAEPQMGISMKKHSKGKLQMCFARTKRADRSKDEQNNKQKNQKEIREKCKDVRENCKNAQTADGTFVKTECQTNAADFQTKQEVYQASDEAAKGKLADCQELECGQDGSLDRLGSGHAQSTGRQYEKDSCQIRQMEGYEVSRQIRQMEDYKEIRQLKQMEDNKDASRIMQMEDNEDSSQIRHDPVGDNLLYKEQAGKEMVVFLQKYKKHMKRKKLIKGSILGLMCACLIGLCGLGYSKLYDKVPSVIRLRANTPQSLDLNVPMAGEVVSASGLGAASWGTEPVTIDLNRNVTLTAAASRNYQMDVKLFGILPFKQVDIQVIDDMELIPVGVTVGIYVKTDGILVVDVGSFEGGAGVSYSPAKYILMAGDYIMRVNNRPVNQREDFIELVENSGGKEIVLSIRRGNESMDVKVKPVKDQGGTYKLGIWLRDDAQGVGTLTFIDENGNFGALGHGINDVDTSTLMEMEDGTLYKTEIISIKKGTSGSPGEMTGMIVYSNDRILGDIDANSLEGIFGTCNSGAMSLSNAQPLPIALKQEIMRGAAQILCNVDGAPKYYDVEITDIHLDHDNVNRGIELKVTDPELLAITGGIVQGMSGAPIVQNGKFVGAVTHVLVQDASRGYGIFIENMLMHEG
jgi:stage IV sporulation protein B